MTSTVTPILLLDALDGRLHGVDAGLAVVGNSDCFSMRQRRNGAEQNGAKATNDRLLQRKSSLLVRGALQHRA